jgi:hypothetical protein
MYAPSLEYSSPAADLVYAAKADGKIAHVSEVVSGLACGCCCPACGMAVIAKKGQELTHHFSHEAQSSCRGAAETALHRLAKEIVEEALRLWLPEVKAACGKETHILHKAGEVRFTRAQSEAHHLSDIIPDLFVERGERRLLVEICVTHACDEAKVAELRAKGIATVEIDLSGVPRDASRSDVKSAVLRAAPRDWVYHPAIDAKIEAMRAASAAEEQRRRDALERTVNEAAAAYATGLAAVAARPPLRLSRTSEIFRAGYGRYIGIKVDGAGCFTVASREWQLILLRDAFGPRADNADPVYRVKTLFGWFKELGLIHDSFRYVAPEIEQALLTRNIGFLSPYRSIKQYLESLKARGAIDKIQAAYCAPRLVAAILTLRQMDERRRENRQSLIQRADRILAFLPETERCGLTGAAWLEIPQENGMSLTGEIERDDPGVDLVFSKLRAIEGMLFNNGRMAEYFLALPLAAELGRQRTLRKAEADAREAENQRKLREAVESRLERLRHTAAPLGPDSEEWLGAPQTELANRTPMEAASAGERELDHALGILNRELRRRSAAAKQVQALIDVRSELESKVHAILGDAAKPFLASPYKELDRKKPLEFCIDAATLRTCEALAEKVRKARR